MLKFGTKLAEGAVGIVWKGSVAPHTEESAIKCIRCEELDMELVTATVREIEISWRLSILCPHIVRCSGFSINPPFISVLMELCTVGSLSEILAQREHGLCEYLMLAKQAASAVAHMHALEMVHRDLKSLNIFVTRIAGTLEAKLGDFGETVTLEEAMKEPPCQKGTLQWMAPEIIDNWKAKTQEDYEGSPYMCSADCYSLAVIVWECATQQVPYSATRRDPLSGRKLLGVWLSDAIVERHIRPHEGGPMLTSDGRPVSADLNLLIERGWVSEPTERITALEFEHGLQCEIDQLGRRSAVDEDFIHFHV